MHRRAAVALIGLFLALGLGGCAMARHRQQVREGLLTRGLHRGAFLKEWGLPSQTFTYQSADWVFRADPYFGRWEQPVYEVWAYPARATCLTFDRVRLVSWETGTTDCDPHGTGEVPAPPPS